MNLQEWAASVAAKYDLVISDIDGTLVSPASGNTFRQGAWDFQIIDARADFMRCLHEAGVTLAFATNQGGVAQGYLEQSSILSTLEFLAKLCRVDPLMVFACFTYPHAKVAEFAMDNDPMRKPNPGMLNAAMRQFCLMRGYTMPGEPNGVMLVNPYLLETDPALDAATQSAIAAEHIATHTAPVLDLTRVLMVGDRQEDLQAAFAAHVEYKDANVFFVSLS